MKVGIARGHVVLELKLTPEEVQRIVERGSFVYIMSHGYAHNFGVACIDAGVLAGKERGEIEEAAKAEVRK